MNVEEAYRRFHPAVEAGESLTLTVRSGVTLTGEAVAFAPEASVVIIPEDGTPIVVLVSAITEAS